MSQKTEQENSEAYRYFKLRKRSNRNFKLMCASGAFTLGVASVGLVFGPEEATMFAVSVSLFVMMASGIASAVQRTKASEVNPNRNAEFKTVNKSEE